MHELRRLVQRKQLEVKTAVAHPGTMVDNGLADALHRLDALETATVLAAGGDQPSARMLAEWDHLRRMRVVGRHSPAAWWRRRRSRLAETSPSR